MSLTDCSRCWESPCMCGWEYRYRRLEWIKALHKIIGKVIAFRELHPNAKFSDCVSSTHTNDDTKFLESMSEE